MTPPDQIIDWVVGDHLGLSIPAHVDALRAGGEAFLTYAFQVSGVLGADNAISAITRLEACPGGSTGRKFFLSVNYVSPSANLQQDLFIKFSRDFDDDIRDRGKDQLQSEVRLALLSRNPDFPIVVPTCYFADYHAASGTGILITQSIPFGSNGIEPLYEKCLDYTMPEPLEHYQAIFRNLGRLAGTHKSGRIEDSVAKHFPYIPASQSLNQPMRYNVEQLLRRVEKLSDFATGYPALLPANIASADFLAKLAAEIPQFLLHEAFIKQYLQSQPDYIALIHWNANVDNAWFWRDDAGQLQCGLMDWGNVNQMNVGLACWGALSAAESSMWNDNLETLLALFVEEFHAAGGSGLCVEELRRQLFLASAMMSLSWLMDAPALIARQISDSASCIDRLHPDIRNHERARTQLLMLSNVLNLWQRYDFGRVLMRLVAH
jgi:hypothetical protein